MTNKTLVAVALAGVITASTAASALTPIPPTFGGDGGGFNPPSIFTNDPTYGKKFDGDWESSGMKPPIKYQHDNSMMQNLTSPLFIPCWDGIKDECSDPPPGGCTTPTELGLPWECPSLLQSGWEVPVKSKLRYK